MSGKKILDGLREALDQQGLHASLISGGLVLSSTQGLRAVEVAARSHWNARRRLVGGTRPEWDELPSADRARQVLEMAESIEAYEVALWDPIKTAQRDGCHVLAWNGELKSLQMDRNPGSGWRENITLWRPAPLGPEGETDRNV